MRSEDARYLIIKPMLLDGKIQTFLDIFQFIPPSIVAKDLGKRGPRFTELMNGLEDFTLKEMLTLARLFKLTRAEMFQLVDNQLSTRKNDKNPD
jgi:hypothetical protein